MSDWWQADPVASAPSGRPQITVTPLQKSFLNAMSAGESPDYNTMYGGGRFEEMNDHPRQAVPIRSGPNAGKTSSAAGRYQFLGSTWDEAKNALGLPDFSPDSQDAAAVWLADRDYKARTGRDLWSDLDSAKNDPSKANFIAGALNRTWTSLPGGAEPNRASNGFGQRFASDISAQSRQGGDWWAKDPVAGAEQEGPQRAKVGMTEAIGRGIQQGATFNFGDEIAGAKAASGIPENIQRAASVVPGLNLIAPAVGAARMGYEALAGQGDATDAYNRTVEAQREGNKQAQEQRPYSTLAGNVAGALALPVGGVLNAATLPARIGAGAAVGAGMGALAGAGEGEGLADRASRATVGGGIGGLVGGAAAPVVEGALQAGRAAMNPVVNAVRGAVNPEGEAARRVAITIARDIQADPGAANRLTPAEFVASVQQGGPAMLMDIGGEGSRALGRSAANTSPEGRQALNQAINDRFESQTQRLTDWIRSKFNYPNAAAQADAIRETAKNVNRGNYERVMHANPVVSVPAEITERPAVAQAMKDAVSLAKNYGEKLENAPQTRTILSGDGYHIADDVVEPAKTSLRYWDYVKKALDSRIEKMKRGGGIDELDSKQKADFRGLVDAKNALVAHLDDVAKGYKEARQGAAAFFGAENALEAGQNFVTQNFAVHETRVALAKMSPAERKLFQDGFMSRYIEMLEKSGDRRNVLNQVTNSPAAREKIELVIGKQRAAELEATKRVEGIMDLARGTVQGNSTTARQLAELGFAGGTGVTGIAGIYNQDPATMTTAAIAGALLAGRRGIDTRVARRVAELLVSDDPQRLMRGIQIVARNDRFMDGLRVADRKIASIGAAESPKGLLPVQAIAGGHADEQPDVNGPRRQ